MTAAALTGGGKVKGKRRFSFKSLSKQMESIDLDTIVGFGNASTSPNTLTGAYVPMDSLSTNPALTPSFFTNGISEWREMNCTRHFATFVNEVYPLVGPLPHILFNGDEIVRLLLKYINSEGSGDSARAPYAVLSSLLLRDLGLSFKRFCLPLIDAIISNLLKLTTQQDPTGRVVGEMEMVLGSLYHMIKYSIGLGIVERNDITSLMLRTIFSPATSPIHSSFVPMMLEIISFLVLNDKVEIEKVFLGLQDSPSISFSTSWPTFVVVIVIKARGEENANDILDFATSLTPVEILTELLEMLYDEIEPEALATTMILSALRENKEKMLVYASFISRNHFFNESCQLFYKTMNPFLILAIFCNPKNNANLPRNPKQLQNVFLVEHNLLRLLEVDEDYPNLNIFKTIFADYQFSYENLSFYSKESDKLFLLIRLLRCQGVSFEQCPKTKALIQSMDPLDCDLLIASLTITTPLFEKNVYEEFSSKALIDSSKDYSLVLLKIIESSSFKVPEEYWRYLLKNLSSYSIERFSILVHRLKDCSSTLIDPSKIVPYLLYACSSIRMASLRILDHYYKGENCIIRSLIEIEAIPLTFNSDRRKGILLQILLQKLPGLHDSEDGRNNGNVSKSNNNNISNNNDIRLTAKIVVFSLLGMLINAFRPLEEELKEPLFVLLMDGRSNGIYVKAGREGLLLLMNEMSTYQFIPTVDCSTCATSYEQIISLVDARITAPFNKADPFNNGSIRAFLTFLSCHPTIVDTVHSEFERIFLFDVFFDEKLTTPTPTTSTTYLSTIVKANLCLLIKCLSGLKSSGRLAEIKDFLYSYLAFPDPLTQSTSLQTICSLKLFSMRSEVLEYLPIIQSLIPLKDASGPTNTQNNEDQLAFLSSEQENLSNGTTKLWEDGLRPLLIPIIYGRMTCKLGSRNGMQSRRKTLLNYVSTWTTASIEEFITFLSKDRNGKRSIGILNLLEDVISKMGGKILLDPSSRRLLWNLLMDIRKENPSNPQIEALVIRRILNCFTCFSSFKGLVEMDSVVVGDCWSIIDEKLALLHKEYTHSPSSLMSLLHCWATSPLLKESFLAGGFNGFNDFCSGGYSDTEMKTNNNNNNKKNKKNIFHAFSLCLKEESVIGSVVDLILDIFTSFKDEPSVVDFLLEGLSGRIVHSLKGGEPSLKQLERCIDLLLQLSKSSTSSTNTLYKEPLYLALKDILSLPSQKSKVIEGKKRVLPLIPCVIGYDGESKPEDATNQKAISFLELMKTLLDPCDPAFLGEDECYAVAVSTLEEVLLLMKKQKDQPLLLPNDIDLFYSLLSLLNKRSSVEIGSFDLDAQVKAFSIIRSLAATKETDERRWEIILCILHPILLRPDDGNARQQALMIVITFLRNNQTSPMVVDRLLKIVGSALSNKEALKDAKWESVQMDSLRLFSEIIHRCPCFSTLRPLIGRSIGDEEPNTDSNTLMSLLHIQIHRRIRAFNRLGAFLDDSVIECPITLVTDCFIPLCLKNLTVLQGMDASATTPPPAHLVTASIECWSSCLSRLPSNQVYSRLNYLISRIRPSTIEGTGTAPQQCKIWLRQISYASQSKFFAQKSSSITSTKRLALVKNLFSVLEEKPTSSSKKKSSSDLVRGNILVAISSLLKDSSIEEAGKNVDDEDDVVDVVNKNIKADQQVNNAQSLSSSIKKLYTTLVGILSSSNFDRREDGRKWIVSLLEGNPAHFPALLKEMASLLQEKTSSTSTTSIQPNPANPHIFSYTIWFILQSNIKGLPGFVGGFDYSTDGTGLETETTATITTTAETTIQILLSTIKSSLTGRQLQEREAKEWTGKAVEVGQCKAPVILEFLVKYVRHPLQSVIVPLLEFSSSRRITKQFTLEHLTTLMAVLAKSIQQGLEGRVCALVDCMSVDGSTNSSVSSDQYVNTNKVMATKELTDIKTMIYILLTKEDQSIGCMEGEQRFVVLQKIKEMSFRVLTYMLKKNIPNQQTFEDFLPILKDSIVSFAKGPVLDSSMKAMISMLICPSGPPVIDESSIMLPLKERVLEMIIGGDYAQAPLKLLTSILQHPSLTFENRQFNDEKLRKLINLVVIQGQLGIKEAHPLLKAILKTGTIRTEIYSLATHLREQMIEGTDAVVRTLSRSLYLHFLKEYPLGKDRWEMEIQFLLGNLSYKTSGGRESIVLLLGSLASMHRKTLVSDTDIDIETNTIDSESWIIALVSQRSGEEDERVGRAINCSLEAIFASLSSRSLKRFITNIWLPWLESGQEGLEGVALSLLPQITKIDPSLHGELWSLINDKVCSVIFGSDGTSRSGCDEQISDDIPSILRCIIVDLSTKQDGSFIENALNLLFSPKCNPSKVVFELETILTFIAGDVANGGSGGGDNNTTSTKTNITPKRKDVSFETYIPAMLTTSNPEKALDSLVRVIGLSVGGLDDCTALIERYDSYCHLFEGRNHTEVEVVECSLSKLIASSIVNDSSSAYRVMLKCLVRQEEERDGRVYGSLLRLNGEVQSLLKEAMGGEDAFQEERQLILKNLSQKRRERLSLNSKWALTNPKAFAKRKLESLKRSGGGGGDRTRKHQKRHQ